MPWVVEAMKDVLDCDKLRGAVKKLWGADVRMGQPNLQQCKLLYLESEPSEVKHLSS